MNQREYEATIEGLRASQAALRDTLLIDTDDGPKLYSEAMDDWQAKDCEVADAAIDAVISQSGAPLLRLYLERGRGHSKTTDIAAVAIGLLFRSRRKLDGVVAAADRDQAGLVRNAIDTILRLNPWLTDFLQVQANKVINVHTGSTLTILSADVASSYGLLIDFCICDELTHWPKRDLFDSLFSAIAKRRYALMLVIANAGYRDHPTYELREAIRTDEAWYFHRLDGPVASWISKKHLAEQARILPAKVHARLWLNEWQDTDGSSLNPNDIEICTTLSGPQAPRDDRVYIGGLDLGLKNDHASLVTLAVDCRNRRVEVVDSRSWRPEDFGGTIDLQVVQYAVAVAHQRYGFAAVGYDPWQCVLLAQQLAEEGVPMREAPFTPQNKDLMARALLEAFTNHRIALYPNADLKRDLMRLRIKEGPVGWRLDAIKDDQGHADRAIAMCIALPSALAVATDGMPYEPRDEVLFI